MAVNVRRRQKAAWPGADVIAIELNENDSATICRIPKMNILTKMELMDRRISYSCLGGVLVAVGVGGVACYDQIPVQLASDSYLSLAPPYKTVSVSGLLAIQSPDGGTTTQVTYDQDLTVSGILHDQAFAESAVVEIGLNQSCNGLQTPSGSPAIDRSAPVSLVAGTGCHQLSANDLSCVLTIDGTADFKLHAAIDTRNGFAPFTAEVCATSGTAEADAYVEFTTDFSTTTNITVEASNHIGPQIPGFITCGSGPAHSCSDLSRSSPVALTIRDPSGNVVLTPAPQQAELYFVTPSPFPSSWLNASGMGACSPTAKQATFQITVGGSSNSQDPVLCVDASGQSPHLSAKLLGASAELTPAPALAVEVDPQPARLQVVGTSGSRAPGSPLYVTVGLTDCEGQGIAGTSLTASSPGASVSTDADAGPPVTSHSGQMQFAVTAPGSVPNSITVNVPATGEQCSFVLQ